MTMHDKQLSEAGHNEVALLAEAVYEPERYASYGLSADWYESTGHRDVAKAASTAWTAGGTGLDAVCLELQRMGRLEALGGKLGLHQLLTSSVVVADPKAFKLRRQCRLVRDACLKAAAAAERGDLSGALESHSSVSAALAEGGGTITGAECAERTLLALKDQSTRVSPGLQALERAIGRLPLGSLTIVGAQTSVGKSTLCLETILAATSRDERCGYISREDPDEVVGSRLLGSLGGVSSARILDGSALHTHMPGLSKAVAELQRYGDRLLVDNSCGGNEIDVMAAMSRMAARGVRLVVVDYIQVLETSKRADDRRNEIRKVTTQLKAHAHRLKVALILVSQLSRPPKGKENAEPTKHDLKEAGDLEASAEVVILLWRQQESDTAAVNVKVAKCKWGGVGQQFQMRRADGMRLVEVR